MTSASPRTAIAESGGRGAVVAIVTAAAFVRLLRKASPRRKRSATGPSATRIGAILASLGMFRSAFRLRSVWIFSCHWATVARASGSAQPRGRGQAATQTLGSAALGRRRPRGRSARRRAVGGRWGGLGGGVRGIVRAAAQTVVVEAGGDEAGAYGRQHREKRAERDPQPAG